MGFSYTWVQLATAAAFVRQWVGVEAVNVTSTENQKDWQIRAHQDYLEAWVRFEGDRKRPAKVLRQDFFDACRLFEKEEAARIFAAAKKRIAFTSTSDEPTKLLTAWLGRSPTEAEVGFLCQWLWQVKRCAWGLADEYQIMLVLTGTSGAGKSTAIQRLVEPLAAYATPVSLKVLTTDKFTLSALCEGNLIGVCNELAGSNGADLETLKTLITDRVIPLRRMYKDGQSKGFSTMSFIGTSNHNVGIKLADPTGMRRFVSFDCSAMSQSGVNSVDYQRLWQSVDETQEAAPVRAYQAELRELQKQYTPADALEDFFAATGLAPKPATNKVQTTRIYQAWRDFCSERGEAPGSQQHLTLRLKERGFTWRDRARISGLTGQYGVVYIAPGSTLPSDAATDDAPN
jgi:hypothetical protein